MLLMKCQLPEANWEVPKLEIHLFATKLRKNCYDKNYRLTLHVEEMFQEKQLFSWSYTVTIQWRNSTRFWWNEQNEYHQWVVNGYHVPSDVIQWRQKITYIVSCPKLHNLNLIIRNIRQTPKMTLKLMFSKCFFKNVTEKKCT